MQIINKGVILKEEKLIEEKLKLLPDNWFCIGGDANRFTFKNGLSTQIDFIIICPYGIFFIESKNIAIIEKSSSDGNIYFLNQKGEKVFKNIQSKRSNPVEEIFNIRYHFINWFTEKGLSDFFTFFNDKKNLKIFFHALVVLSNEDNIKYKNCELDKLPYTTHKNKTLIGASELNEDYFKNIVIPFSCKELSQNEMAFLFKLFYYPELSLTDLFNQFKIFENQLFAEKEIFLEKIKYIEKENEELNERSQNIHSMNQILLEDNEKYKNESKELKLKIEELSHQKKALIQDNEIYKIDLQERDKKLKDLEELKEKILDKEKENSILSKKYEKIKTFDNKNFISVIHRKSKIYQGAFFVCLVLFILQGSYIVYMFNLKNDSYLLKSNDSYKILASIEKFYFTIESFFDKKKYDKILDLWQKEILKNSEFNTNIFKQYNLIFYYIAIAYQNKKSYENAIKYYDIFIELSKDADSLVTAYYHKGSCYLDLKSKLDQAILDFKKAIKLNSGDNKKKEESGDYQLNIVFRYKLGNAYALISIAKPSEKEQYEKSLGITDFYQEALFYYKEALSLTRSDDLENQVQLYSTIANIHFKNEKYSNAIQVYKLLVKKINEDEKYIREVISSKNGLATSYLMLKNFKLAESYYLESIQLIENSSGKLKDKKSYYKSGILLNLGAMYLKYSKLKKAVQYLEEAYELAKVLNLPNLNTYEEKLKNARDLLKINLDKD